MSNSKMDNPYKGKDCARFVMTVQLRCKDIKAGEDAVDLLRTTFGGGMLNTLPGLKDILNKNLPEGFEVIGTDAEFTK